MKGWMSKMTDREKEAIQMLRGGLSVRFVSQKTGLSAFWLNLQKGNNGGGYSEQ
jgi:hypothetical protein